MSDLVKRLKHADAHYPHHPLYWEAADRIEALEAALQWIADVPWSEDSTMRIMQIGAVNNYARLALAPEQER